MNDEELEGKFKQVKGKVREEVGDVTGDKSEEYKGKAEQFEGKVQEEGQEGFTKVKEVGKEISQTESPQVSHTEESKTTVKQVSEKPGTIDEPTRAQQVASKSGEVVGAGLKKVEQVIDKFAAGLSSGMKSDRPAEEGERQVQQQQTTYQSQQPQKMEEASPSYVKEEETVEKKKVIKQE